MSVDAIFSRPRFKVPPIKGLSGESLRKAGIIAKATTAPVKAAVLVYALSQGELPEHLSALRVRAQANHSFELALRQALQREGRPSNIKGDHGGMTAHGISLYLYNQVREEEGLTPITFKELQNLSPSKVRAYYRREYWTPSGAAKLPCPIAVAVFDEAVNASPTKAREHIDDAKSEIPIIHRIQNKRHYFKRLLDQYLEDRRDYYLNIVEANPSQTKFRRGWLNRLSRLGSFLKIHHKDCPV